jgi:hypothetical protein
MPRLTRWLLKSALLYLVASLLLGVVLAAPHPAALDGLMPVYFHLFMVGWVTQMIFGVAHWMFPRFSPEKPRGNERVAAAACVALNAGLIARALAEPMLGSGPGALWGGILILSGVLQWLGALAFAVGLWPRVKAR